MNTPLCDVDNDDAGVDGPSNPITITISAALKPVSTPNPFSFSNTASGINASGSPTDGSTFVFSSPATTLPFAFNTVVGGKSNQNGTNPSFGSVAFNFSVGPAAAAGNSSNTFGASVTQDKHDLPRSAANTDKKRNVKKGHVNAKATSSTSQPSFGWTLDTSKLQNSGGNVKGDSSNMVSVKKVFVPAYLHNSEFYKSLQDNDDEPILVPSDCMKIHDAVSSNEDLRSLLMTLRFWVGNCICDSILKYVASRPPEATEATLAEFIPDFPVLKHFRPLTTSRTPMETAMISGEVELVKYCLKLGHAWPALACNKIATIGNVEMLRYALQAGCKPTSLSTELAALHGHLDCLRLLHESGALWNRSVVIAAVDGGHLHCLQYAHQQGLPLFSKLYAYAVTANSLEIVKYLCENGVPWEDVKACEAAAADNKLEFLRYMHENGAPWDILNCSVAAQHHHVESVLYLLSTGCYPSNNIWDFVGEDFHRILQAFLEQEHSWYATPEATLRVVETGFLEGLISLIDNGCIWHPATTSRIVEKNNLAMLRLVHERDCPWNSYTCAKAESMEVLTYAHTHGAPIPRDTLEKMLEPSSHDPRMVNFECFKYVHQHGGCPLQPSFTYCAARDGNLELLKYLHEQGCQWVPEAPIIAAQYGHADCLDYILSHGCVYLDDVLRKAELSGNDTCIAVAKRHRGDPVSDTF